MALKVHNSLSRRKELFEPLEPRRVRMYVCGVTVYDLCHIGHARALVVFDMVYRYLRYLGYQVTYVRNFTDVDDKIIERANREGLSYRAVADRYIEAFYRDFDRLGLLRPEVEPKASDYVEEMVRMTERLLERGYAYAAGGDVFYSVAKFPSYGRLSGKKIEELEAGARVEVHEGKRDPLDFALWKAAKPGEPSWPSPWGEGRPGWHIECSVMSAHHLGETFDIHGGGRDLQFPHHDNEIAQSEAATGKTFARYWIHNGFINIDKAKMSKSLGNILTIDDILKEHHPEAVRLFILSHHYRSPIDYNDQALADAKKNLDYFYTVKQRCEELLEAAGVGLGEADHPLPEELGDLEADFREAMDDDFNSALALGGLFKAAGTLNTYLDGEADVAKKGPAAGRFLEKLEAVAGVLGILEEEPSEYFKKGLSELDEGLIEARVAERSAARKARDWALADSIRDELARMGVVVEDKPDGTVVWKVRKQT